MILDSTWGRELGLAARRLRKTPGFAAVAVATLAIGIGVNAAMFGLIDSLLFRPPAHVSEPDRVVRVQFTSGPATPNPKSWYAANYPALEALRNTNAFEAIGGYYPEKVSLGRGADAVEASAIFVTPEFFRVLGVRAFAGSLFGAGFSEPADENRVVLSYGFWQRQFGRDPRIIGGHLLVGTASYVVAGVLPNGFTSLQDRAADVWLPMNDLAAGYLTREWRTNARSYLARRRRPHTGVDYGGFVADRATAMLRLTARR